jgi:hypothetical protein
MHCPRYLVQIRIVEVLKNHSSKPRFIGFLSEVVVSKFSVDAFHAERRRRVMVWSSLAPPFAWCLVPASFVALLLSRFALRRSLVAFSWLLAGDIFYWTVSGTVGRKGGPSHCLDVFASRNRRRQDSPLESWCLHVPPNPFPCLK